MSGEGWVIFTYRLAAEPSRHRVAVWRELRRAGALSLQQATWAVPNRPGFLEGVERAARLVERAGGEALTLDASPRDDASAAALERLFAQAREAEWREFLSECDKFNAEIDKEIRTQKFTAAELDEEEQSLERLRRWHRDLRGRDVFESSLRADSDQRLKECAERLEEFAERVFERGGR